MILNMTGKGGSNSDFIVTMHDDGQFNITADKTFNEIQSAYLTGKNIVVNVDQTSPSRLIAADGKFVYYPDFGNIWFEAEVYCEDSNNYYTPYIGEYYLYSDNYSEFYGDYYYNTSSATATPSDVVSGKVFYNASGYQTGTAIGSDGHKVTITQSGNATKCYVQYNNTKYYTVNNTFYVADGDTILLYVTDSAINNFVYVNEELVASESTAISYTFTVTKDLNIKLNGGTIKSIAVYEYIVPTGTLYVTSNSSFYHVYNYSNVDVSVPTEENAIIEKTLSGTYINGGVTTIGSGIFQYNLSLTSIAFPNVISIYDDSFLGCWKLTSMSFPQLSLISTSAFAYCYSLPSVELSQVVSIGTRAFYDCSSLSYVSFSEATSIGGVAFGQCSALTTVYCPKAKYIGPSAFGSCYSLSTVNITSAYSIYSNAFLQCRTLSTLSLPFVKMIGSSAFRSCWKLESLYLLGSSIPTLSNINAFYSTPISGYTYSNGGRMGTIYVPSSLYSSYLTATYWSAFSSRFVSV